MPLSTLRYEPLAVVGQVVARLHLGGGVFKYTADESEINAASADALHERFYVVLKKDPTPHPDTGSVVQHVVTEATPLCRGRPTGVVLASTQPDEFMEQIARAIRGTAGRLATAGALQIYRDLNTAQVTGNGTVDRRYLNSEPGCGWGIRAGQAIHNVQQHVITVSGITHTIDFSLGAGGMISQWRTSDGASLDQQHLNMGAGTSSTMGFGRGVQSSILAYHNQAEALRYTFNPKQGGDIWAPSASPPYDANALLAGGAPVLRFKKSVAPSGETTFDITTVPVDWDPDGTFWSTFYGIGATQSMYAGAGKGRPALCTGTLLHTRWTFCWDGHPNVHKCQVWWDLQDTLGDAAVCQLMPIMRAATMHLRSGSDVNEECYAYDGSAELRTALHSNVTLWPDPDETSEWVATPQAIAIRDPYQSVLTSALRSGNGGIYFRSDATESCIGIHMRMTPFGVLDSAWGMFVDPWNDGTSEPDRFQDAHHSIGPLVGGTHPSLQTPAPPMVKGIRGPFTHYVLTGDQSAVEANMRMLAAMTDYNYGLSTGRPFA